MSSHFRLSSLLRPKLAELNVSAEAVLREAGLPASLFDQAKIYLDTAQFFALWRALDHVAGDPALGLKLGDEKRLERYDPIAISLLYTRSFRDAVTRAGRYKQLMSPEKIHLVPKADEVAVVFEWTMAKETEPPLLTDLCFSWLQAIGHRGSNERVTPIRIEFERRAANRELYEKHFNCPVRFRAGRNAVIYGKADMDRPFLTYNPDLLAALAPQLDEELRYQRKQESLVEQVKSALKRLLAGQKPDIAHVARELGQSTRTLQRKLAEAGRTFQDLLAEARRELARHYLLYSGRELNETAYLLGYADANSFFRAFQKWEGVSPGRWRDKQIAASG